MATEASSKKSKLIKMHFKNGDMNYQVFDEHMRFKIHCIAPIDSCSEQEQILLNTGTLVWPMEQMKVLFRIMKHEFIELVY